MIDVLDAGMGVLRSRDISRLPLIAFAGLITSMGPCAAPRYLAMTAIAGNGTNHRFRVGAFIAGLLAAYATLAAGAGLLNYACASAGLIDSVFAAALAIAGSWMIVRPARACACSSRSSIGAGPAGAFVLGYGSGFVVSPCCTPIIAAVGTTFASSDDPRFGVLYLLIFGLSHAAPLVLSGTLGRYLPRLPASPSKTVAVSVVSGALLLALSAYYSLQA